MSISNVKKYLNIKNLVSGPQKYFGGHNLATPVLNSFLVELSQKSFGNEKIAALTPTMIKCGWNATSSAECAKQ